MQPRLKIIIDFDGTLTTEEQQAALTVHRTRDLLNGQRTQLINSLRAHLAELGLVAEQGREGLPNCKQLSRIKLGAPRFRLLCAPR